MKTIKIQFSITTFFYTAVYLFKTFVIWEFTNPFQWIIDIPTYTDFNRFMILFYVLFYYTSSIIIIKSNVKSK